MRSKPISRFSRAALVNSALYDHAPALVAAHRARGDEIVAHGRTNAERQGTLDETAERALIADATAILKEGEGRAPEGWLGPWISHSHLTPDLLAEAGYRYLLDWCMDDQPIWFRCKAGRLSRQRGALRSRWCAERLRVGDEIVSRNLHRSRDVLLCLLGRRELLRRRKLIALRAASATAALAALRLHQAGRACHDHESDQHVLRHDGSSYTIAAACPERIHARAERSDE